MSRIDTLESRRVATPDRRTEQAAMVTAAGGSASVAIGGICVAGLAIAGLANAIPATLAAIATIVFGIVLALQGGALGAQYLRFFSEARSQLSMEGMAGMGGVIAGGIAGIVLGILSLLGIVPVLLMAVSAIVFGVSLWLSGTASSRISALEPVGAGVSDDVRFMTHEAVWMTAGIDALVGLAAVVLGIIGVVASTSATAWFAGLVLTLVALLCLGCAVLVSGSAVCTKLMSFWARR
jgi:hypothetical protein